MATYDFSNLDVQRASHNETVLILEDEEDARIMMATALRAEGFQVLEASHPYQAMEMLRSELYDIQLLIIDINLPAMSGDEFARAMLAEHPFLRIVFASAMHEDDLESRLAHVRYQCFLQKPFTLEALSEAVRLTLVCGSMG